MLFTTRQADHLRVSRLSVADSPADLPAHAIIGNLHVRGYKEEGTITTPFDMAVLNDLDRFHLAGDAIDRLPQLGARAAHLQQRLTDQLTEHRMYIRQHGEDMPAVRDWRRWKPAG